MNSYIGVADTAEQAALREIVRSFLDAELPMSRVREVAGVDPGWGTSAWRRMTGELGLTGLPVAEIRGGQGATFAEACVVLGELGRVLAPLPYLATAVGAAVLEAVETDLAAPIREQLLAGGPAALAVTEQGRPWRPSQPETRASDARLCGTKVLVPDLVAAQVLLVTAAGDDGPGLYAVRPGRGVECRPRPGMDPTRSLGEVELAGAAAIRLGGRELTSYALSLLYTGIAAECAGAAARALELTVEHLQAREQFGRPIGSFQALRHRAADLAVAVEAATATADYAAQLAAGGPSDELSVAAPLAKAACADAFGTVAGEMIQLHGGIGFTWEHDAHLYFKRAKSAELLHGTPRELRELAFDRGRSALDSVTASGPGR